MEEKVSFELVTVIANPSENTCDEQLQCAENEAEDSAAEASTEEVEKGIDHDMETEHEPEGSTELKTPIDTRQLPTIYIEELEDETELANGVSALGTCRVNTVVNLLPLPRSADTCSLSPSQYEEVMEEQRRKRQEWCEGSILIAIIATVWLLMLFPIIFYNAVPAETAAMETGGETMQTACSSPAVYSGVCQEFLQRQQTCLGVPSNGVLVPQGRGDEVLAQLFITALPQFLTLSPGCAAVIEQFLCYYIFGLCDSSTGELYLPSSGECRMVTEETCGPELEQAMMFIAGIPDIQLPQCDTLPDITLECTTGNVSNITDTAPPNTTVANGNDTAISSSQPLTCNKGFYNTTLNGVSVCKPECGEWQQYSDEAVLAIDVILVTQAIVFLLSGTLVVVLSVMQRKRMFKFPSVFIVYGTVTLGVYELFHVIRVFDQKGLFCSSVDLNETVNNPTAYCSVQGSALYYASFLQTIFWCCHVIMVFFSVYFPFRAKFLERNGYFVYIHIVMVAVALVLASVPVIAAFGTGGFIVSRFPTVNCFASNVDVTFYALEFPLSLLLATGSSLILLIFYKVFGVIRKQIREKKKGLLRVALTDRLHMNPAELKVLILFIYSVIFAIVGLIGFTVGAHNARAFVAELTAHFTCEAAGVSGNKTVCEKNFSIWQTEVLADLAWVLLGLYPIVNLIYVVNVRDIKKIVSKWFRKSDFHTFTHSTKFETEQLS